MSRALALLVLSACIPKIDRGPAAFEEAKAPVRVLTEAEPASPMIYLQATIAAGSSYDPSGQEGLAHLTARSLTEAGAGERSAEQVRQALLPTGQELELVVDRDWVTLRLACHLDHADVCLALFTDTLTAPRFDAADVERIRDAAAYDVESGLLASEEDLGHEVLQAWLFEGHPYGHPVQGRFGVVPLLDHEAAADFYRSHYVRRAVVAGIGGAYTDEHLATLTTALEALPGEPMPDRPLLPAPTFEGRELLAVDTDGAVTGLHIGHAIDVTRAHPDWPALYLGLAVLGIHRRSDGRLYERMRTRRGLNYGSYAYVESYSQRGWSRMQEQGTLRAKPYFYLWIRPVAEENGPFAAKMALRELEAVVADGITAEEHALMQAFLVANVQLWASDPGRRLAYALEAEASGTPNLLAALPERFAALTVDEVNAALAAHIHPDNVRIVAVTGDAEGFRDKTIEEIETPIVYGDVVPSDEQAAEDTEIANDSVELNASWVVPAQGFFR